MDRNLQQELFSLAYIRAVAAAAGYSASRPEVDDDSIDLMICKAGGNGTARSPRLELQVKSTGGTTPGDDHILFDLKIKNYEDLRGDTLVPRILVLVLVPKELEEWVEHKEESMMLRRCGYWLSLHGNPGTDNKTTVRVTLPRSNLFNVDGLCAIMDMIAEGARP